MIENLAVILSMHTNKHESSGNISVNSCPFAVQKTETA
jgi:hypothetical protein